MAYEYTVEEARRLVRVRMWGVITPREIREVADAVARDERTADGLRQLVDLTGIGSVDHVTTIDVRALASVAFQPVSGRAFVTEHTIVFGLLRMFISLREMTNTREQNGVFNTVAEAEHWLDSVST